MEPNGKQFVRFLNNVMVQAKPYAQGEIASFAPHIVGELLAAQCVEMFTPQKQADGFENIAKIETASMPMQAVESAVIETKKPRKQRGK